MNKEALEYIADKLGVAIDWTAKNVYPPILDALSRYLVYKISLSSIGLVLGLALVILAVFSFRALIKDRALCGPKNEKTRFYYYSKYLEEVELADNGFNTLLCAIFAAIFGTALTIACTCIVLKWSFVPEVAFVEMITRAGG